MSVQNVECQLTQAQLKRYLAGDEFPAELVESLERHLRSCEDCLAEAHKLREALGGGPLNDSEPESGLFHRLAAPAAEAPPPPGASAGVRAVFAALATRKNVAMSVGLAIVLVAMSTAFRSPTNLLGPKASEAKVAEQPAKNKTDEPTTDGGHETESSDVAKDDHTEATADGHEAKEPQSHESKSTPQAGADQGHKAATRTDSTADKPLGGRVLIAEGGRTVDTHASPEKPPVTKKPSARRKPTARRTAAPKKPQNGTVRVYDENGRLKTPN
jgi:hypothetical protein